MSKFYDVPAGTPPSICRGEACRKRMYWIINPTTRRKIPIDCDVFGGREPSEAVDTRQLDAFSFEPPDVHDGRGVSHFETCVDVDDFTHARTRR